MGARQATKGIVTNKDKRMAIKPSAPVDDRLLTVRGVADYLERGVSTVWRDVRAGRLPKPFYLSPRAPRWRRSDLDAAISQK